MALLVMFNPEAGRSYFHGVDPALLREYGEALELPLLAVRGNCDFSGENPETRVVTAGNVRIFMAHGHDLGVRGTREVLVRLARENGCRIALYGHTHKGDTHYEEGIYVMNPGSPSQPRDGRASYGIIDLTDAGIVPFLVEV